MWRAARRGASPGFALPLSAKRRPWLFSQHRPSRRRMRCTAMRVHLLPRGGGTLLASSQSREAPKGVGRSANEQGRFGCSVPDTFSTKAGVSNFPCLHRSGTAPRILALPGFADDLEGLEDRELVKVLLAELRVAVLRQF